MTKIVGYTTGVFDLFHIGHLNILKKAKEHCDYLIVGVTTDEEVLRKKNITTFIPFEERKEIVESIKYVDEVVAENDTDKRVAWETLEFDVLFKGDDWRGTKEFNMYKEYFEKKNVEIKFFPYTKSTSSTKLRKLIQNNLDSFEVGDKNQF